MIDTVISSGIIDLRKLMFASIQKSRQDDPFLPIKIITANNYQSAELKYFAALRGVDLMNVSFMSFDLLVDEINGLEIYGDESDEIRDARRDLAHASRADRVLLMESAIKGENLSYFHEAVKFLGFNTALQATFNDLEEQGAMSDDYLRLLKPSGKGTVSGLNSDKLRDIYVILSRYSVGLKDFRTAGADAADAILILKRHMEISSRGGSGKLTDLYGSKGPSPSTLTTPAIFYGFSELTAPQQTIVSLLGSLTEVKFCMVVRDDPIFSPFKDKNAFLFENIETSSQDILGIRHVVEDEKGVVDDVGGKHLEHAVNGPELISKEIFKVETSGIQPGRMAGNAVMIFESPGTRHEVSEIMRQIAQAIDQGKTNLTDIAIAYREDIYRTLLIENFLRLNIPFFIKDGVRLSECITGRMLIGFLNASEDRWHRRELVNFLRYFQPKIDVAAFDLISRKLGLYEDLPDLIKKIRHQEPEGQFDESFKSALIEALSELEDLTVRYRSAKTFLQLVETTGQVLNLVHARYLVTREPSADDVVTAVGERESEHSTTVALPSELDLYESIINELNKFSNARIGGLETFDPRTTFRELIGEALKKNSSPIGNFLYSGVNVIPFERLRYLSFSTVYFPGMSYKSYPMKRGQDPILLDSEKSILNGLDRGSDPNISAKSNVKLQLSSASIREEKALFALALSSVRDRAVLSYASHDISLEKALLPSFYLLKVAEAIDGKVFDHSTLKSDCSVFKKFGTDPSLTTEAAFLSSEELSLAGLYPKLRIKTALSDLRNNQIHQRREDLHKDQHFKGSEKSYEGVFNNAVALEQMEKYILKGRKEFSPTMLEAFATCPFKAFGERILRVKALEEPENLFEVEPMIFGTMIHEILQKFMIKNGNILEEYKVGAVRNSDSREGGGLDQLKASMTEIASYVFEEYEGSGHLGNPFIWSFHRKDVMEDLYKFVEKECVETGLTPKYFEVSLNIGVPDLMELAAQQVNKNAAQTIPKFSDSLSADEILDQRSSEKFQNVIIRGRIDRIDTDRSRHRFTVIDYKTGKPFDKKQFSSNSVNGGRTLQIPLYFLLALQKYENEAKEVDIINSEAYYYYVTSKNDFSKFIFTGAAFTSSIQQVMLVVCISLELMSKGFFPAVPFSANDRKCLYCDLRSICGSTGRKITPDEVDPRMRDLERLREVQ